MEKELVAFCRGNVVGGNEGGAEEIEMLDIAGGIAPAFDALL